MINNVKIQKYAEEYAVDTVQMWRDSKEKAISQPEEHDFESHLYFLKNSLSKTHQIFLAIETSINQSIGILAVQVDEESLDQLYIHVDFQNKGIGTILLDKAKQLSSKSLKLFTFEVNKNAQRFYEKHGFKIIGRGIAEQEQLPDIEYKWIKEK